MSQLCSEMLKCERYISKGYKNQGGFCRKMQPGPLRCVFNVILNPDSCLFKLQLKAEEVKPSSFVQSSSLFSEICDTE